MRQNKAPDSVATALRRRKETGAPRHSGAATGSTSDPTTRAKNPLVRRGFQQLEFRNLFTPPVIRTGRDLVLEARARELLESLGVLRLASKLRVEWNPRLRSAAGRAEYWRALVTLNPLLQEHSEAEIDRTLLHELAHLLAQFRVGRRRILPHGEEWRIACRDLGIAGELRCHTLPFPVRRRLRRFIYACPNCGRDFPRVRRIRRTVACLDCCRKHSRGQFDPRFRLALVRQPTRDTLDATLVKSREA